MKIIPDSFYFFINSWTWGYEDILKAIGKEERNIVDKLLSTDRSTKPVSGEKIDCDPPEERTFGDKGKGKGTRAARYYARESEDTDFGDSDDEQDGS